MKLRVEQLQEALQKKLEKIYFISGDEPLQSGEAADAVRLQAKQHGFLNRELMTVGKGFSWLELRSAADSLSIFSDKKIIDLRIPDGKPGAEGGKAIVDYCSRPPDDTILLISSARVAKSAQKSRWFQTLDETGVMVQVWPLEGQGLLQWLDRRMQSRGMQADQEGLRILASRIEGNLLAGAQEIEKLYVLNGRGRLSSQSVLEAVADSSRYDVFNLADAVISGKIDRALKILQTLKGEGLAVPLVLWALAREARMLLAVKSALARGENRERVYSRHQVWSNRKSLVEKALHRLSRSELEQVLIFSAQADRQVKGLEPGSPWETLAFICQVFSSDQVFHNA